MKRAILRVRRDGTFRIELILKDKIEVVEGIEEVEVEDNEGKMLIATDGYSVFIEEIGMQEGKIFLN